MPFDWLLRRRLNGRWNDVLEAMGTARERPHLIL